MLIRTYTNLSVRPLLRTHLPPGIIALPLNSKNISNFEHPFAAAEETASKPLASNFLAKYADGKYFS